MDLSGSDQGAGGVGGLLGTKRGASATRFMAYDGNGNIVGVVDGGTGKGLVRVVYSPFGELIAREGDEEQEKYGYSTKWGDPDTGLRYYGYRFYSPWLGRWLGRDPFEESGGINLHGAVGNDPINRIDRLGLDFSWEEPIVSKVPMPKPDAQGNRQEGRTDWTKDPTSGIIQMQPEGKVYPSCCDGCYKVYLNGGKAQVVVTWSEDVLIPGTRTNLTHELEHVAFHFKPAYLAYKKAALKLHEGCYSEPKANCYLAVVLGQMNLYYSAMAYKTGAAYDCLTYGNSNPASEACQRAKFNAGRLNQIKQTLDNELKKCDAMQ